MIPIRCGGRPLRKLVTWSRDSVLGGPGHAVKSNSMSARLKFMSYAILRHQYGIWQVPPAVLTAAVFVYRKPPNISPGLIFVRKHFLVGLYMGGLYTDKILC